MDTNDHYGARKYMALFSYPGYATGQGWTMISRILEGAAEGTN